MIGKVWTDAHKRDLARLLARYGRRAVVEAAKTMPRARPAGYRRRENEAQAALLEDLEWIERRAETERERGPKRGALDRAINERFRRTTPKAGQSDEGLKKFEKRIKNVRAEHARAERVFQDARKRTLKARRLSIRNNR